jgi:hypothetical protein
VRLLQTLEQICKLACHDGSPFFYCEKALGMQCGVISTNNHLTVVVVPVLAERVQDISQLLLFAASGHAAVNCAGSSQQAYYLW